jgi:hypothetical protein
MSPTLKAIQTNRATNRVVPRITDRIAGSREGLKPSGFVVVEVVAEERLGVM